MSSILTNTSAMVALQTLKGINKNLEMTQSQISTGKAVATAKDNSAVWAISKVMEADVNGFKAISDSLSLGESTVAVGQKAAETVTDLLGQMKEKIVSAQNENVDRTKLQTDISALRDQINSVVGAAQFNGLNLVQGTDDVNVLASLDRQSDGTVSSSNITVARQDMSTDAGTYGSAGGASLTTNLDADISTAGTQSSTAAASAGQTSTVALTATTFTSSTFTIQLGGSSVSVDATTDTSITSATTAGDALVAKITALGLSGVSATNTTGTLTISNTNSFDSVAVVATGGGAGAGQVNVDGGGATTTDTATIRQRAETITFSAGASVNEGDSYKVTIDGTAYSYVAGKGETMEDIAKGLKTALDGGDVNGLTTKAAQDSSGAWTLQVDNDGTGSTSITMAFAGQAGGTASGGLFGLDNIDVTTDSGATAALGNIETLIDNSIDAAASFGSAAGRIEIQNDFIGALSDSLKAGIGTMVDADMEAASARLQALQVQQQLGTQALSIANQAPQNILSLFR